MNSFDSLNERSGGRLLLGLVIVLLAGLPLAVGLDLRHLSIANLGRQASDLNVAITDIRDFYATDVVGHVLSAHTRTVVTPDFQSIPGAIPIPATFSLELGRVISANQDKIQYRFVSDYPFKRRAPHQLDTFERSALTTFRSEPGRRQLVDVSWRGFDNRVRLVAPIIMGQTCVACHNTHPDSQKRDWKVGDVRGIQEISIIEPVATNLFSFQYLLTYFGIAGSLSFGFIALQRRQARTIRHVNEQLAQTNDFLASISSKISRYLSPQIYKRIFSGEKDVTIHTERKKLTICFSDIKDFTATTERLQPEELTSLLNEYFTEMSTIAFAHGGTVDKFVGDAVIVFFGDPETRGVVDDAKACLRMAVAMQVRLAELSVIWHSRGIAAPFRVRIGINSGFCDVGNFGSDQRMDYTIIGAAMNLAARLQSIAEPGAIVVSEETFILVRDIVAGHPLAAVTIRGFRYDIVPYVIDALLDPSEQQKHVFTEHADGMDLYLDVDRVGDQESERLRNVLSDALDALDVRANYVRPSTVGGVHMDRTHSRSRRSKDRAIPMFDAFARAGDPLSKAEIVRRDGSRSSEANRSQLALLTESSELEPAVVPTITPPSSMNKRRRTLLQGGGVLVSVAGYWVLRNFGFAPDQYIAVVSLGWMLAVILSVATRSP